MRHSDNRAPSFAFSGYVTSIMPNEWANYQSDKAFFCDQFPQLLYFSLERSVIHEGKAGFLTVTDMLNS